MKKVSFFNLKKSFEVYEKEINDSLKRVCSSGWYLLGKELDQFENNFSKYCGTKYCIGVGSGLDALIIILRSYKELGILKDKDEVLVDLIKNIISNKQESHILVFSEHDNSFENLYSVLEQNDISYMKLHGSNSRIQNILKKYEEGSIKILFLNARHQGSGINLESTTDLVFYHRMSKEMEKQVIGRGYRIGRYNKLDVHFLLHDNEKDFDKSNNLYEVQCNKTLEI